MGGGWGEEGWRGVRVQALLQSRGRAKSHAFGEGWCLVFCRGLDLCSTVFGSVSDSVYVLSTAFGTLSVTVYGKVYGKVPDSPADTIYLTL